MSTISNVLPQQVASNPINHMGTGLAIISFMDLRAIAVMIDMMAIEEQVFQLYARLLRPDNYTTLFLSADRVSKELSWVGQAYADLIGSPRREEELNAPAALPEEELSAQAVQLNLKIRTCGQLLTRGVPVDNLLVRNTINTACQLSHRLCHALYHVVSQRDSQTSPDITR